MLQTKNGLVNLTCNELRRARKAQGSPGAQALIRNMYTHAYLFEAAYSNKCVTQVYLSIYLGDVSLSECIGKHM